MENKRNNQNNEKSENNENNNGVDNKTNNNNNKKSNPSVIIWGTQCTVDYKFTLNAEEFREVIHHFLEENTLGNCIDDLNRISQTGLLRDEEPKADIDGNNLEKALDYVRGKGFPCKSELGGSPAISALAGYYLGQGSADLPEVYFCGAKPASVTEFLEKEAADLGELFKYSAENKAKPRTLGLEVDKFKLMLSCKSGRSLNDLMSKSPKQREFETDLAGLKKQIKSKNCIPEEVMHQLESLVQKYSSRSGAAIKDFCQKLNSLKKSETTVLPAFTSTGTGLDPMSIIQSTSCPCWSRQK